MQIRRFEAKLESLLTNFPVQDPGHEHNGEPHAATQRKSRSRKNRSTRQSDRVQRRRSANAHRAESRLPPTQSPHPFPTHPSNSEQLQALREAENFPVLAHRLLGSKNLDDRRRLDLWGCACALEYPYLCVYGGFARSKRTDCLLVYNVESSSWETKHAPPAPEGPGARVSASLLALGQGYALLLFGRRGPSEPCSDPWLLDTRTFRWLPVRPAGKTQPRAATDSASLCSEAGVENFAPSTEGDTPIGLRDRCSLAPTGQHFAPDETGDVAPSDHPAGRWRHAACVRQTAWTRTECGARGVAEVWIMAGVNGAQPIGDSVLDDLWRLAIEINEIETPNRLVNCQSNWSRVAGRGDAPPPLHSFAMMASSTHLFLFGGLRGDATNEGPIPLEDVYAFNINSGVWRRQRTRCAMSVGGEKNTAVLESLEWKFLGILPNSDRSWRCRLGGAFSPAGAELFLVGGGGICFTFGSHADPPIAVKLLPFFLNDADTGSESSATLPMPGLDTAVSVQANASFVPAAEAEARSSDGPEQGAANGQGKGDGSNAPSSPSSDTWLVVRNRRDVKWIKTILEEHCIYDRERKIMSVPEDVVSLVASNLNLRQNCASGDQEPFLQSSASLTMIPVCRLFQIDAVLNQGQSVFTSDLTATDGLHSNLCFFNYSGEETKRQPVFSLDVAMAESILEAARELSASSAFLENCSSLRASLLKSTHKSITPAERPESSRPKLLTLPRKFERLGNAVLLPAGSLDGLRAFLAEGEPQVGARRLEALMWKQLARRLRAETIGVQAPITGPKRQSQVHILHGTSGVVHHQENGVVYHFDVTKCMFASGNGTERARFVNLIRAGESAEAETVVDLFCGIGYFSLAALTCAGVDRLKHLHACDWNRDALQFFEAALALNHVDPGRVTLNFCDSFQMPGHGRAQRHGEATHSEEALGPPPASLVGKADRVSLGLIPSSEQAWRTALSLIHRERGGMLHVHGVGAMEFVEKPAHSLRVGCQAGRWNLVSEPGVCAVDYECKLSTTSRFKASEATHAVIRGQKLYLGRDIGRDLAFAQYVLRRLAGIAVSSFPSLFGTGRDCTWAFSLCHVERVKSYAPKQYHFVVDVSCRPESVLSGSSSACTQ
ncbi:hypothetical protein NCLIV_042270 [Neospora caninum Liverpool]|uniref:tRNA wybutosine-synthesizing protein 2 homolog n=1 Tax=Neospora caninum (strain Liverpool) TaxID=572307 RepID=F0VC20_NEOCL|nr:hypothetical protein NCLIV_042270 [Neospora caninum Liverpool]CBZ51154.1 hypothetical protein NCLIV_042270 [Neospora caninum Liverpool]CEL68464.1 TPA: tRNA wybutosine-synthesizing protein 2 homolog [Neospora caninum Liverpool]|eukprot:XP_003881187.1 hypothetical protein NCLIV_042270 [Neospora caninum Liverpool]